jgi:G3E family GTPase
MNPILLPSKFVAQSGYRFTIVINDIGKIGIDNQLMKQNIHFLFGRGGVER